MLIFSYFIKIFLMVHSYLQTCNICGNKKGMKRNLYFSSVGVFETTWIRPEPAYHALWDLRLSW